MCQFIFRKSSLIPDRDQEVWNGAKIIAFLYTTAAEASRPPKKSLVFSDWRAVGPDRREIILVFPKEFIHAQFFHVFVPRPAAL